MKTEKDTVYFKGLRRGRKKQQEETLEEDSYDGRNSTVDNFYKGK